MDKVRAKFYVVRFEKQLWNHAPNQEEMTTVVLAPVHSSEANPENKEFWKYTPTGEIKLGTINKSAAEYFKLGEEYYIDFTKAEKVETAPRKADILVKEPA